MYYTYVLLCSDKRLYTGYTPDLRNRLQQHKQGKVISTKNRLPVQLIYYEACEDKFDALRREKNIKVLAWKDLSQEAFKTISHSAFGLRSVSGRTITRHCEE